MPNIKKVIPFPLSGLWTFYDWVDSDGSNPIEKWLAKESDEVRMFFNSALKEARNRRNCFEWSCYRHKMKGIAGAEGVHELGFKVQGRSYRLLVKFDGVQQAVILCGCYHKMQQWTPRDAPETAAKRARALAKGEANRHERAIQDDF